MMLKESSGGALYGVFIQPFLDTANVIKGEIGKTGAKALGTAAQGLVGAFSVLLPMFNKIPFTGKTWQEAIQGIKTRTKDAISAIDTKYANSYKAIASGFQNPDLAFLAFSLNPGLYLGTALASNAVGTSLGVVESMLGGSGKVSQAYSNFLGQIGIFTPGFASGGGTHIDVGMGGSGDSGGIYENVSKRKLKKAISLLVEEAVVSIQGQQQDPEFRQAFSDYQKVLQIFSKQGIVLDNPAKNNIFTNFKTFKTKNDIEKRKSIIDELSKLTTARDVLTAIGIDPKPIFTGDKVKSIVAATVKALATEIAEGIKKANSNKPPETLDEFIATLKTTQNQQLKKAESDFIESNIKDEKLKSNKSLEAIVNVLGEKEKTEIREQYKKMVKEFNSKNTKENLQEQITTAINNQFKNAKIVPEEIIDQLTNLITSKLNTAS